MTIAQAPATPATESSTSALDLLFFNSALQVVESTEAPDTGAGIPAEGIRQLARFLVNPPPDATWPTPFQALRSSARRLVRAQLLLLDAERSERLKLDTAAVWAEVHAEWAWVRDAPFVRKHLLSHAREIGLDEPEAQVEQVVAAIDGELVPIFHLKWLLLAPTGGSGIQLHKRFLQTWALRPETGGGLVDLYRLYLLTLLEAEEEPGGLVDENLVQLLRKRSTAEPPLARMLSSYVALQLRSVRKQIEAQASANWFERRAETVKRVVSAGGFSLGMFEVLSTMHLMAGVRHARDTSASGLPAAARHLAKAVVLDPCDGTARAQLHQVVEASAALRQEATELAKAGRLAAESLTLIQSMDDAVQHALNYADGNEARAISERREALILPALAQRLSRDASDSGQLDLMHDLVLAIDGCAESGSDLSDYPDLVHARAVQLCPELNDLPWERITPILERGVLPAGFLLPMMLPEPEQPTLRALAGSVFESSQQDGTSEAPVRPRGERLGAWVFSSRDLAFKAAAAVGVALVLYSAGMRTTQAVGNALAARAYERTASGVRTGDDVKTIDAGLRFFSIADDAGPDDSRAPQVRTWLENALLRRVAALLESSQNEELQKLLGRYERAFPNTPIQPAPEAGREEL